MATGNVKSVAREENTYASGKSGGRTPVIKAKSDGGMPAPQGNPTKGGGINRATKGNA